MTKKPSLNTASAPLARYNVLTTSDLDELRQAVINNYHPVHCDVGKRSNFSIYYNHVFLKGLSLSYHTITDKVFIHSGPTEDSYLLQFGMIQGVSEIFYGKSSVIVTPNNDGSIISTTQNCRWRYEKHQQQLIARIEKNRLEDVLHSMIGRPVKEPIEFEHKMRREDPGIQSVRRQLFFIMQELGEEGGLFSQSILAEQAVDTFLISLLDTQPHNYTTCLSTPVSAAEPHYISRVEEYIRAHLQETLRTVDLAQRFDISLRSLQAGFKKHRGYSLSNFIKQMRLQHAHQLIQMNPHCTIEQIAMASGFRHWGQFSADYQKKFGERPIDTRKKWCK